MCLHTLEPHVRACGTSDGIVLLDLRTGRYMGLTHDEIETTEADLCVRIAPASDEVTSAEVLRSARPDVWQFAQLLLAYARASALLRWWSLEAIVRHVNRKAVRYAQRAAPNEHGDIRSRTSAYRCLRPLVFTARDACLLDSLVLIEFLFQSRLPATWVVGVKTQPFAAHSWVQHGAVVLNDSVGRVSSYTPILAV